MMEMTREMAIGKIHRAVVTGAVLGLWVIESVSIAVDQWFGVRADPGSTVVSLAVIPPFAVLAVVGAVPLWLLLRRLPRGPFEHPGGAGPGSLPLRRPAGPGA